MEVYHDNKRRDKTIPGLSSVIHRKRTIESYSPLLEKYEAAYADRVWILWVQT